MIRFVSIRHRRNLYMSLTSATYFRNLVLTSPSTIWQWYRSICTFTNELPTLSTRACASSCRLRKYPGISRVIDRLDQQLNAMSQSPPPIVRLWRNVSRMAERSTPAGCTPAITCTRGHSQSARAYASAVCIAARNSFSRPGSAAKPRSPATQSPGGVLISTSSKLCFSNHAARSAAGYS